MQSNEIIYTFNPNFLQHGHVDVFVANNIVFISIEGLSSKTNSDWIFCFNEKYYPYINFAFSYLLNKTQYYGNIKEDGFVYFDTLNNVETISASMFYTIE